MYLYYIVFIVIVIDFIVICLFRAYTKLQMRSDLQWITVKQQIEHNNTKLLLCIITTQKLAIEYRYSCLQSTATRLNTFTGIII